MRVGWFGRFRIWLLRLLILTIKVKTIEPKNLWLPGASRLDLEGRVYFGRVEKIREAALTQAVGV
jgi:hypothetical protein